MANNIIRERTARAQYSFATDGGTAGTITPSITETIPSGAIITDVKIRCTTIVTSGGAATIAINGGGSILKAAETIANCELDATGVIDVIRAGNAGATGTAKYIPIVAVSSSAITLTVATANLTAGVFDIYVTYLAND